MKGDAELLWVMESRHGFKLVNPKKPSGKQANTQGDWPDWRGPQRDERVPRLPSRLPATRKLIWKQPAMTDALAGLSVSEGRLLLAERDFDDEYDVYRCLNTDNGEELWSIEFPARGSLDYGLDKVYAYSGGTETTAHRFTRIQSSTTSTPIQNRNSLP